MFVSVVLFHSHSHSLTLRLISIHSRLLRLTFKWLEIYICIFVYLLNRPKFHAYRLNMHVHSKHTLTQFECHGALENGNHTRNNTNSYIQNNSLEILKENNKWTYLERECDWREKHTQRKIFAKTCVVMWWQMTYHINFGAIKLWSRTVAIPEIRHKTTKNLLNFFLSTRKRIPHSLNRNPNNAFSNCARNNDSLNAFISTHRLMMLLHGLANLFFLAPAT